MKNSVRAGTLLLRILEMKDANKQRKAICEISALFDVNGYNMFIGKRLQSIETSVEEDINENKTRRSTS